MTFKALIMLDQYSCSFRNSNIFIITQQGENQGLSALPANIFASSWLFHRAGEHTQPPPIASQSTAPQRQDAPR